MSSREFKRAFIRILKCQIRRRPRLFLDEACHPMAASTEMSKMSRFVSIRNFNRRSKNRREPKRGISSATSLLLQTTNVKNRYQQESPIASLRLLHNHQRQITMDTMVSDEESGINDDSSDDDRSDLPNECDALMDKSANHRHEIGNIDYSIGKQHRTHKSHKTRWRNIPDIIIDEASSFTSEAMHRNSIDEDLVETALTGDLVNVNSISNDVNKYEQQDDSIMWL